MRFLVLLTDAYNSVGGIAKYNRDLLKTLCSYPKCSQVVAIPRIGQPHQQDLPPKLRYVTSGIDNKIKYIISVFKTVFSNSEFDLIICGHIHLIPLAIILKYLLRCPVVLIIHGIEAWKPTRSFITNCLVKKINFYLAVSGLTKKRFAEWTKIDKIPGYIISNCIDVNEFGLGPKNIDLVNQYKLNGKKVIFTMARLNSNERYKGIDEVLEIMPELLKEAPNLVYMIGGDGDDRKRLEGKARILKISDHVIFIGYIPENGKADYYRLADAYVMPGKGEGFGIVYLEALACGVPVLTSCMDASCEIIIHNDLGIAVNPSSSTEIKKAILKLIYRNRDIRPNEILNSFSYETYQNQIYKLLDALSL